MGCQTRTEICKQSGVKNLLISDDIEIHKKVSMTQYSNEYHIILCLWCWPVEGVYLDCLFE